MILQDRIKILNELNHFIQSEKSTIGHVMEAAYLKNKWFTVANQQLALQAIADHYLAPSLLENWTNNYSLEERYPLSHKKVALIPAGNIPLVGFHDVLCIFLTGHSMVIKYSEKDQVLTPFIVRKLTELAEKRGVEWKVEEVEQLKDYDAVIATGSNNTARYFEYYFGHNPNIIRRNRNGIALLNGRESKKDLSALGMDVFQYFGLGCRNISKLYVPKDYNFDLLLEALYEFKEVMWHEPYKNNFDYNYAVHSLGRESFQANGCILIKESETIPSRIGVLHFEYYQTLDGLKDKLLQEKDSIQCLVAKEPFSVAGIESFRFGEAQQPNLFNYADGIDTLSFLLSL
ncbi:MAG: hypothetical protein RLZZ248_1735 [Bacteroidota bacterium]